MSDRNETGWPKTHEEISEFSTRFQVSGERVTSLQRVVTLAGCGSGIVLGSRETDVDNSSYPGLPFTTWSKLIMASISLRGKPRPGVAENLPGAILLESQGASVYNKPSLSATML